MKVFEVWFLHLKFTEVILSTLFPDGDQMESMDTVSLQAVTLADGSTAYIQHDSKASFSDGQIMDGQVIQLEDGSAAYVQHVSMPKAGKSIYETDSYSYQILFFCCLTGIKQRVKCFTLLYSPETLHADIQNF